MKKATKEALNTLVEKALRSRDTDTMYRKIMAEFDEIVAKEGVETDMDALAFTKSLRE